MDKMQVVLYTLVLVLVHHGLPELPAPSWRWAAFKSPVYS